MGTTGTITGVSQFLKEKNPAIRIIGAQPSEGSRIPGIRKWPQEYLPKIYDPANVDELIYVSQGDAEDMCRRMAREEGIFAGISAAGACWVAQEIAKRDVDATIVFHRLRPRVTVYRCFPTVKSVIGARTMHGQLHERMPSSFARNAQRRWQSSPALEDGGDKNAPALPACELHAIWNNPTPVLAAVIEYHGQILLARNAAWPGKMYALITGFMEAGETPQGGIAREIAEETNLTTSALNLDWRVRLPAHEPGHHRLPRGVPW